MCGVPVFEACHYGSLFRGDEGVMGCLSEECEAAFGTANLLEPVKMHNLRRRLAEANKGCPEEFTSEEELQLVLHFFSPTTA